MLSKNLKQILLSSVSLLMLVSTGASSVSNTAVPQAIHASVRRRYRRARPRYRRYRVRRAKRNRRYARKSYRRRKPSRVKKTKSRKYRRTYRRATYRKPTLYNFHSFNQAESAFANGKVKGNYVKVNGRVYRVKNANQFRAQVKAQRSQLKAYQQQQRQQKHQQEARQRLQVNPAYDAQQSKDAVKQMNHYREEDGLAPYHEDSELDNIAMLRAKNMANHKESFAHCDKNGNGYAEDDAYQLGYISSPNNEYFSENISEGPDSAKQGNEGFMFKDADSDWGHRDNILNNRPKYPNRYAGAGYYDGYLVEEFTIAPTNKLDQVYHPNEYSNN